MLSALEIRQKFLKFFEKNQHQLVGSDSILRKDDPTLMFTNAGMNQFKNIFVGNEPKKFPAVANTQKCLRISGKHNDLEDVGKDTYHHTFFEMLGNWSFGDYFKEKAIGLAFEFLTTELELDPKDFYASVFQGNQDVPFDQEAKDIWLQYLPEDHIILGNAKDNFWEMGEVGPCGSCSELHLDLRPEDQKQTVSGASLVNQDHPQVVEIWNLVFMEFNRKKDGSLEALPHKNIDTGMGFERLVMAVQKKASTYDTDVFASLIQRVEQESNIAYGTEPQTDIAIRVVVDHIRTIAFCIADGLVPSNNKEGYVLRRVIRRAIRYAYSFLNIKQPFLFQLIDIIEHQMASVFPELAQSRDLTVKIVLDEEKSFLTTLKSGLDRLEQYLAQCDSNQEISGAFIFELYDTFGFPSDLSALILSEKGFTYNHSEYQQAMAQQKQRARAAAEKDYAEWTILAPITPTTFLGYDQTTLSANLLAYRQVTEKNRQYFELITDHTPFYTEGGGQKGDQGHMQSGEYRFSIANTLNINDQTTHISPDFDPKLLPNNTLTLTVDTANRHQSAQHHTATHLLHHALRTVLGSHVEQRGSQVSSKGLRFDFSHFEKVTPQQLSEIESIVNQQILHGYALEENRSCPFDQAKAKGAMALFGEKYSDTVRTIQFGPSIELCGGIHVQNTNELMEFKITKESASSSGIRRIEALAGQALLQFYKTKALELDAIQNLVKNKKDTLSVIQKNIDTNATLAKEIEHYKKKELLTLADQIEEDCQRQQAHFPLYVPLEIDPKSLKQLATILQQQYTELNKTLLILNTHKEQRTLLIVNIGESQFSSNAKDIGKLYTDQWSQIKGGGSPKQVTLTNLPQMNLGEVLSVLGLDQLDV